MQKLNSFEMVECPERKELFPVEDCYGCLFFKGETLGGIKCDFEEDAKN